MFSPVHGFMPSAIQFWISVQIAQIGSVRCSGSHLCKSRLNVRNCHAAQVGATALQGGARADPGPHMALKASGTHAALDLAAVMAAEPEEGDEVPAGVPKPKAGNDGT